MTIQIYGTFFNGTETCRIEQYFDNMDDAQKAWERAIERCKNCIDVQLRAIKNPNDNVRASQKYMANPWISGSLIGTYTK